MSKVLVEPSPTPLTAFKLLSFDVYGTLIDWETGIYNAIVNSAPLSRLPSDSPLKDRKSLIQRYERHERSIQIKHPGLEYADLLAAVYTAILDDMSIGGTRRDEIDAAATAFGQSVGQWPAFPDTLDALRKLQSHYKLVPLSNSSPSTFGASLEGPFKGFSFDKYYLAADIGSYKPDPRNFEYLLEHAKKDFGVEKGEVLHVAQSLHHDHVPATEFGLARCWVDREGVMGEPVGEVSVNWKVKSLGELAGLVEEAFGEGK